MSDEVERLVLEVQNAAVRVQADAATGAAGWLVAKNVKALTDAALALGAARERARLRAAWAALRSLLMMRGGVARTIADIDALLDPDAPDAAKGGA